MNEPETTRNMTAIEVIRARTPARLLVGRVGPAYRTATQLELRRDHAFADEMIHESVPSLTMGFERATDRLCAVPHSGPGARQRLLDSD